MQRVGMWMMFFVTAVVGALIGAVFVGYPVGVRNEAIKCNVVWNLNDIYTTERLASSSLSKTQLLDKIRSDALARHRYMEDKISHSYLETLLVRRSKEIQKGMARIESLAAKLPEGQRE